MEVKKIKKILTISKQDMESYRKMMTADDLDYGEYGISRYSTVKSWAVDFGNGYEMDLKVCSGDSGEPLWCEAVLFKNGCEVECSEVYDNLEGVWGLFDINGGVDCSLEVKAV